MIRTLSICEKNLAIVPCNPITIPPATNKEVILDQLGTADEIAYITIQNVGDNDCYYAFGQTCDAVKNFHGKLIAGSGLSIPTQCQVNCYSTDGTIIATTIMKRGGGI